MRTPKLKSKATHVKEGPATIVSVRTSTLVTGVSFPPSSRETFSHTDVPPEMASGPIIIGVLTSIDAEVTSYGSSPRCSPIYRTGGTGASASTTVTSFISINGCLTYTTWVETLGLATGKSIFKAKDIVKTPHSTHSVTMATEITSPPRGGTSSPDSPAYIPGIVGIGGPGTHVDSTVGPSFHT